MILIMMLTCPSDHTACVAWVGLVIFLLSINPKIPPEECIVERAGVDSLAMGEE